MLARQLLDGGSKALQTPTAEAIRQAFEGAWIKVAPAYKDADAQTRDSVRVTLAECVLAVIRDGDTDAAEVERLALQMFRVSTTTGLGRGHQPRP
jgi:hypothetical protein